MNNKKTFILSLFQLLLGSFAIVAFFLLREAGENMTKWTVTLILAAAFVVLGAIGLVDSAGKGKKD